MSRDVFWMAIGLFALNLGALIGWAVAYRPSLVLTNEHDGRTDHASADVAMTIVRRAISSMRSIGRLIAGVTVTAYRRARQIGAGLSVGPRLAAAPTAPPKQHEPRDHDALESKPAADAALERWLSELDAGDRAETTTHDDDPDQWWRAWAETHGSQAAGDGGNNSPLAAGSGRDRRKATSRDVQTTA